MKIGSKKQKMKTERAVKAEEEHSDFCLGTLVVRALPPCEK